MSISHLKYLEAESIHIFREVMGQFDRPVMLYSVGKDSSVLVHLARKAFFPGRVPFPLLHVDTGFKFAEMYTFRDEFCAKHQLDLRVWTNREAVAQGANPYKLGTVTCCGLLKTRALLDALADGDYDAAFGGARRDEEKSRAKERIFSFRDEKGRWDPKNQRPELWDLYNGRHKKGETTRVFPLSNWTEMDIWNYILSEEIPIVPLYFAQEREVVTMGGQLIPVERFPFPDKLSKPVQRVKCRFRSLGCSPCSGAVRSQAVTVADIVAEMASVRSSERATRVIDHDREGSMEEKKREGYF